MAAFFKYRDLFALVLYKLLTQEIEHAKTPYVLEGMSCEQLFIFFPNIAYMAILDKITKPVISQKIDKKVIEAARKRSEIENLGLICF